MGTGHPRRHDRPVISAFVARSIRATVDVNAGGVSAAVARADIVCPSGDRTATAHIGARRNEAAFRPNDMPGCYPVFSRALSRTGPLPRPQRTNV